MTVASILISTGQHANRTSYRCIFDDRCSTEINRGGSFVDIRDGNGQRLVERQTSLVGRANDDGVTRFGFKVQRSTNLE